MWGSKERQYRRWYWILGIIWTLGYSGIAHAQSITVTLNEQSRSYRNTGTISLRYGEGVPTSYRFATGGFGRGSAPFGFYVIGAFRGLDDDPNNIGPRWMLRGPKAKDDGDSYDPKLGDMRYYIELHRARRSSGTQGCLGVLTDADGWKDFMAKLNLIIAQGGPVAFILEGNPLATGESIPFENVSHRKYKRRKHVGHKATQSSHSHGNHKGKRRRHSRH